MAVCDSPVRLTKFSSDFPCLIRVLRSFSNSVLPALRPVSMKLVESITATSVDAVPTPFSSRVIVWGDTPTCLAMTFRDQPFDTRASRNSTIRLARLSPPCSGRTGDPAEPLLTFGPMQFDGGIRKGVLIFR